MSSNRSVTVSLLLLLLFAQGAACWASEGVSIETAAGPGSSVVVRSVTWSNSPAPDPDPVPMPGAATPATFPRDARSYLWIDQNHQNAIAERVAITGDGAHIIAGWWLNNMRVSTYDTEVDALPEWWRPMTVQFQIDVDADQTGAMLTATGRGDSLYTFDAASPTPTHSGSFPAPQVGYRCAVSSSGNTYMGASGNPDGTSGEVYVWDGSGTFLFKAPLTAPPEGVDVSADGLVVAANVRTYVKIWDALTGALRDSVAIPGETQVPAVLSGDGSILVTSGFSHLVRVYLWNGTDYAPLWTYNLTGTTWATALAVSDDGSTIAAGGWLSTGSYGGRVALLDIGSAIPLWIDASYGDWVSSLSLTADGSLLAAGSWGRSGDTFGNIVTVYDRDTGVPIQHIQDDAIGGVGSCLSVDISADGLFLVAGGKAVHAREFGNGGWVMAAQLTDLSGIHPNGNIVTAPMLSASPNPFLGAVRIAPAIPGGPAAGTLRVFAADGRLVRDLGESKALSGWTWDGNDALGRSVPAGNYFVKGNGAVLRVVRLR